MEAKNKKNQSKVNKCIKALSKYDALNTLRDAAYDDGNERAVNKYNRLCENAFDKYLTYSYELPKYEQKRIEKFFY
jgi:hypothetical protein